MQTFPTGRSASFPTDTPRTEFISGPHPAQLQGHWNERAISWEDFVIQPGLLGQKEQIKGLGTVDMKGQMPSPWRGLASKGRALTRWFFSKFLAVQDLGHSVMRAHLGRALEILTLRESLANIHSERELWK